MTRMGSLLVLAGLALVCAGSATALPPDTRCGAVTIFGPPTQTIEMGQYYLGHPYLVRTGAGCNAYKAFAASGNIACSGDDYFWLKGDVAISGSNGGCKVDNRDSAHRSQGTIWDGQVDVLPPPPAEKCNLAHFKAEADLIFKADGTVVDSMGTDVTSVYARTSCSDPSDTTRLLFKSTEYWVTCSPGSTQGQAALYGKTLYFENMGFRSNIPLGTTGNGTPAQYVPWKVMIAADKYVFVDGYPEAVTYNDAPGNLDTKALFVSAGDIYIGKYGDGAPSNLSRYRGSICANDNVIIKGSLGPPRKPEFIRVTTDSPPFTVASQLDDGSGGKPESKYNSVLFEGTITAFNDGSDPKWNIGSQIYWDQAFVFDCNTYKPMGCYSIEEP